MSHLPRPSIPPATGITTYLSSRTYPSRRPTPLHPLHATSTAPTAVTVIVLLFWVICIADDAEALTPGDLPLGRQPPLRHLLPIHEDGKQHRSR